MEALNSTARELRYAPNILVRNTKPRTDQKIQLKLALAEIKEDARMKDIIVDTKKKEKID